MSRRIAWQPPRSWWRWVSANQQRRIVVMIWLLFLAVGLTATLLSPYFLTAVNLKNVVSQSAPLLLVSIGQTYLMISGGIDFSVGSTIGLVVTVLAIVVTPSPLPIALSIPLAMSLGACVGVVNGLIVTRLHVLPFMATLATLAIVHGIALQLRSTPPAILPREYSTIFLSSVGPIPLPVVIVVVFPLIAGFVLRRTVFGRRIYAVGSNEDVARLSGFSADRLKVTAYVVAGAMAGLAGAFLLARSRAGDPLVGTTFAFDSVTAVVMGGVYLFGGRGSVYGTVAAVFIIGMLSNILNLMGASSQFQALIKGLLLIGAVMLYHQRGKARGVLQPTDALDQPESHEPSTKDPPSRPAER